MQWTEIDSLLLWMPLDHFAISESWGRPNKMHPLIIILLEKFRSTLPYGYWIKVHCGYKEGGHTKNSYHYSGRAVDFHIVGCSLLEAERHLMRFLKRPFFHNNNKQCCLLEYVGIGIYPEWQDPGFHLDVRGKKASWSRLNGSYTSYDLGIETARQLGL